MASYTFAAAYAVNTSLTPAAKEQNSVVLQGASLGSAVISDGSGGVNFSGNDVVVSLTIGGTTYYGWISRPIKSGGQVKGFYFWRDANFGDLAAATADGNQDGDGNVSDNTAFVLVVDTSFFTGAGQTVGTSSDRVDTSLNSVLPVNSSPVGVNDSATVLEDALTALSGNVLTNDTDVDQQPLSVTAFSISGQAAPFTLGTAYSIAGVGSLTLSASGAYSFAPVANYAGTVPVVTYTLSDGNGGSSTAKLTLAITAVNDPPAGTSKTVTANEGQAYTFTAADFGYTDPNDTPANALQAVKITSLPGAGTLTLNGAAVTTGQTIAASSIGTLVYTPAANASGVGYASFTFQVQDNGGTSNSGVDLDASPNTITFNITYVNSAPSAVADTGTAIEAGGVSNGTAGSNPSVVAASGVLSNDTDPDGAVTPGTTHTVTAVASGSVGSATSGRYGSLTLNADGSYSYTVDNSNREVQALRTSAQTLTETFTYTVVDTGGLSSKATLSITIQGANDAPVALNDSNVAKESIALSNNYSAGDTTGYRAQGNVLDNDADVDSSANGETRAVSGLFGSAAGIGPAGTSTKITLAGTAPNSLSNDYAYYLSGGSTKVFLKDSANTELRVSAFDNATKVVTMSGIVATSIPASATLYFTSTLNSNNVSATATYGSSSNVDPSATVNVSSITDTLAVGMSVTGTGIPANTFIKAYDPVAGSVTLGDASNNNVVVSLFSSTTLSFSASAGTTVTGRYGTLLLNSDGTYTYTPTPNNSSLAAGATATESFSYRMTDASSATSTAVLTIMVTGSGSTDPRPVADTNTAVEASGFNNGTAGTNLSVVSASGVLSNDTDPDGAITIGVSHTVTHAGTTSASTAVSGGGLSITGSYGTLTIATDGSYTYTVNNSNGTVQALRTASDTVADRFFYRISDGTTTADSTLTITVQGADDTPLAADDTGTSTESGGTGNGTAGQSASGQVLTNDSDVDTAAASLTVSAVRTGALEGAGTSGTVGQALAGTYGSLTLLANGTWTYAVNESNASVQALAAGGSLTDTFNYSVSDGTSADTAVLTVTIRGANDAPINTMPSTVTVNSWATLAFTGGNAISVDDPEAAMAASNPVQLSVAFGTLAVGGAGGTVSGTGTQADPLILTGTLAEMNARLATLVYTPQSGYSGTDTLRMTSEDNGSLTDIDVTAITVSADSRALTVTGTTVNEASDYVIFTVNGVTGSTGQLVRLSLAGLTATAGSDFATALEVYNGSSWTAYTPGSLVSMPAESMMVRVAVLPDSASEGSESLRLTVQNLNATGYTGDSTIVDDATGTRYPASYTPTNNTSSTADLDDDRPLTVGNLSVNEASSHAVFSVGGTAGQVVTLALVAGSATSGTDYGASLQVWDGAAWQPYGSAATIGASGSLLVRTTIGADSSYEGPETFALRATNAGGVSTWGTATILDDGTGNRYDGNVSAGVATTVNGSGLDNDLSVSVSASGPVNEGSAYAMFTVTATNGAALSLTLSATGTVPASIGGFSIQYSTDGTNWTVYSANATPVVPGALGSGTSPVYVRVPISSEADTDYEGAETFSLTATIGSDGAAPLASTAQATIVDDGTGTRYGGTITAGAPTPDTSSLDSDKPTVSVSSVTVSEASPFAVVTVSLSNASTTAVSFTPSLVGGTATVGTDTGNTPSGAAIEYFNGTSWVSAASGVTIAANTTSVLLRTAITNDSTSELSETFSFSTGPITGVVTNSSAATGTVTIKDDGSSGSVFLSGNNTATPTAGTADNDPTVTPALSLSVTAVNTAESGTNASFTVVLTTQPTADVVVTVSSADPTEGTVGPATLTFTSSNWNLAQTVTVSRVDDALDDGDITYLVNLSAASADATYQGKTGAVSVTNADDDAPPTVSVSGVTVSEAAGSATFTVTRSGATGGTTTVDWATVAGTASAGSDYTGTSGTVTFAPGETTKTVTVAIVDDSVAEGAESLTVQLSNAQDASSGAVSIGTASATIGITDDDNAGITVSGGPVSTSEAGSSGSFSVVLNSQPTANVTVTLSGLNSAEGSLSAGTLTFTPSNWNVAQTVTVTGVDDPVVDGSQSYTLTATTSSSDASYAGKTGTVAVSNADNDVQRIASIEARQTIPTGATAPGVIEGQALRFEVQLTPESTRPTSYGWTLGGTASLSDWMGVSFTNGVKGDLASGVLTVPAGVTRFEVIIDTLDDTRVEDPVESVTLTIGGVTGSGGIIDNDTRPVAPVIVDVTENATDPTPSDLLTGDPTQILRVLGTPGLGLVLYTKDGQRISPDQYSVTEFRPGEFRVDAQSVSLLAGDYVVRHVDTFGNESLNSNAFTIDSTPELEDRTSARQVLPGVGLSGQLDVIDQNRVNLGALQSTQPPQRWFDSDGELATFGVGGLSASASGLVIMTLPNGSSLEVNPATGAYLYKPSKQAVIDVFPVTVRDPGGKGGNLALTFEVRDLLDRDGVPANTEADLARRITGNPDLNGDGIPDATQNAVTTMAWTRESHFRNAIQGQMNAVPTTSVVTVVANESAQGNKASSIAQLINFQVLPVNRDGTGGLPVDSLRGASAPWDAISFSIEPLQSLGLVDIDPERPGLQQRITIDISYANVSEGTFLGYVKWISADTIRAANAAGVSLVTLDGLRLSDPAQEGWYDFTRRSPSGDGAQYVIENGKIKAIELILTDNAFGDVDFTVGRFADPGMPVAKMDQTPPLITGPSGTPGAAMTLKTTPENRAEVFRFTANEAVNWVVEGGPDAAQFTINADGLLSFNQAPDFERPSDVGRDNRYELVVKAWDSSGNESTQQLTVTVLDVLEPVPMYRADLRSGDRLLSTDASSASTVATANGSTSGVEFWVMPNPTPDWVPLRAWQNVLTGDLFYAPEGTPLPYACYVPIEAGNLGYVPKPGQGAFDLFLWLNGQGTTQIVSAEVAAAMGLSSKGYLNQGAIFGSAAQLDGTPAVVVVGSVDGGFGG